MSLQKLFIFILALLVVLQVCVVTYFYIRSKPQDIQLLSVTNLNSILKNRTKNVFSDYNNSTSIHDYDIPPNTHKLLQSLKNFALLSTDKPLNSSTANLSTTNSQPWRKGGFCYNFLVDTFRESVTVCSDKTRPDFHSIKCYGNPDSVHMSTCTFRNLVVKPSLFAKATYDADNTDFVHPHDVRLLNDVDTTCVDPNVDSLAQKMEGGDYVLTLTRQVASNQQTSSEVCQQWVNHTVFFFTAHGYHIYFRFLDYYNLHKSILDSKEKQGEYQIIRISEGENYMFSDFDEKLFPNFTTISDLKDVNTCFRKVILVPKCYASVFFQCKMQFDIQNYCFECSGKDLQETSFMSFQSRVLEACGITNDSRKEQQRLVLISRKPYIRSSDDSLDKFQRVLENEEELVHAIRRSLPGVNVTDLQLESLHICDQVRHIRNSDVLMGVHGAGLVHLWWLRDDALAFELEPYYQGSNPSFRMLSTLTGRNYHSVSIDGGFEFVSADTDLVIADLKHKGGFT